ncbi:hypothetical protein B0H65DRAFT_571121 [Neurospora tetraspora]|uniref:Uncharacterized protein n=1 Tax=Neurospora tetraspora TaxID=94610 RepID=A0AAE0MSN4_9PEZI|nr:hypothetical protein B0H65DRAFT_571121 [Neurospora tetraspora]
MQLKLPTDTNARGAGTTSEQQTDTPSSSTSAQNQQILSETGTETTPATPPSDSYWGRLFVQASAKANAHKIENNKLTEENNELKAELEGAKQELRRATIKIVMDEKAREQEAEKLQKANESLEAARNKIASVEAANTDWVLDLYTTQHELRKANAESISVQRAQAALEKVLEDTKLAHDDLEKELEDTKLAKDALEVELEDTKLAQDALEKELEDTKLAQGALEKELEVKKRELCKSESARSYQGEFHETVKQRLLAVENMLYASRRTSTTVASELYVTKQMLQDANEEISAGVSSQAALQEELEDTKRKLHEAVMGRKSSEVERTLLNSSLAIVKLHFYKVKARLSACEQEKDALKRQLSNQSATVETAVSQVVDKIAAVGHSIEGRLSAFENTVESTIGELHDGVQSNGELVSLVERPKPQLSEVKAPTGVLEATTAEQSKQCIESSPEELEDQETSMPESLKLRFQKAVEESNRLTQAGSVAEDADAAIQKGPHEVRETLRDYFTHIEEKMIKEERTVKEAINVARGKVTNHQDWLHRLRKVVAKDTSTLARLTHEGLRHECWERCKMLIEILSGAEKQDDGVRDRIDAVLRGRRNDWGYNYSGPSKLVSWDST